MAKNFVTLTKQNAMKTIIHLTTGLALSTGLLSAQFDPIHESPLDQWVNEVIWPERIAYDSVFCSLDSGTGTIYWEAMNYFQGAGNSTDSILVSSNQGHQKQYEFIHYTDSTYLIDTLHGLNLPHRLIYNSHGQPQTITDRIFYGKRFVYDSLNRIDSIHHFDWGGELLYEFIYANNRIEQVILNHYQSCGGSGPDTLLYHYNINTGQLDSITHQSYFNSLEAAFCYDQQGKVTEIRRPVRQNSFAWNTSFEVSWKFYDTGKSHLNLSETPNNENNIVALPHFYPNPANEQITLESLDPVEVCKIITADGRTIRECRLPGETIEISDLEEGSYYLHIQTKTNEIVKKLIVRR